MNNIAKITFAGAAMITVAIAGQVAAETAAQAHMGHVSTAWGDTPEGMGLLPTALAEAEVAAYHAGVAITEPNDLQWMQDHAAHVLHAINGMGDGPGLGYGVMLAAEGTAFHIGVAAEDESASENIKLHAVHVATSANNVVARAEAIEAVVAKVLAANSASEALPFAMEMQALAIALSAGVDANGDGEVTWEEDEGGLDVATFHMGVMFDGEDL